MLRFGRFISGDLRSHPGLAPCSIALIPTGRRWPAYNHANTPPSSHLSSPTRCNDAMARPSNADRNECESHFLGTKVRRCNGCSNP